MNIIRNKQLGICMIFSIISFALLYPITSTPMAYYILGFVAISILGFAIVLYRFLTKSFTQHNIENISWFLAISALPHVLFSLITYGSWVCLGISIFMIIMLLLNKKSFKIK